MPRLVSQVNFSYLLFILKQIFTVLNSSHLSISTNISPDWTWRCSTKRFKKIILYDLESDRWNASQRLFWVVWKPPSIQPLDKSGFQVIFSAFVYLVWSDCFIFLLLSAISNSVAKPGCPHQCGNMSIPFPFGIGPDCYKEPSFEIICNASSNPPKAYLSVLDVEIIELNQSQIRVSYPKMAVACYNSSRKRRQMRKTESRSLVMDLTVTGFTLSDQNVITAVGCEDMVVAYGKSSRGFVGASCAAFCTSLKNSGDYGFCAQSLPGEGIDDRYMPGFGCCQTVISKGINIFFSQKSWVRVLLYLIRFFFLLML